ncbi:leukemia NUP98 fusion partner 1 [Esox lucius]|uniref:leukemia NUP98 fusion partner 1 n=1 Tax=Esox lucius TaxID=8010 RepID=UPI0005769086|nr:leukemia NUP98 fusion partner 1 [Esox lucius]
MALRLLPAFANEDEDDDGNFTNWMSSYWGHGDSEGGNRKNTERKRSFKRPARTHNDRRASLPCSLDAMQLNRLQLQGSEVRSHSRVRRASSDDNSHAKEFVLEKRITTIPELAESFERRLKLRNKQSEADGLCLICHEVVRNGVGVRLGAGVAAGVGAGVRAGVQELNCSHRFYKEGSRRPEEGRHRSSSVAGACDRRTSGGDQRRMSGDEPFCKEQEDCRVPQRQHSLRRQR